MKIGILTFHSQLNYGGVLQCWALQTALEKLGHEVVVIDRWLDRDNWFLKRGYDSYSTRTWLSFWFRVALGQGNGRKYKRVRRTVQFLQRRLHRTPFHFCEWEELREVGLDLKSHVELLVVGSDQVWNPDWPHTRYYLCESVLEVPRIAYAASIGKKQLTDEQRQYYAAALAKFDAISCREAEACGIVNSLNTASQAVPSAAHVVDPTLLLTREEWRSGLGITMRNGHRKLVYYFLSQEIDCALPLLQNFAGNMHCEVEVLISDQWGDPCVVAMPTSIRRFKTWAIGILRRNFSRVKINVAAGPREFVQAHAEATWVITDSFHSVMFATIFGKNCRALAPSDPGRVGMFSRIEEIAEHAPNLVAADLSSALDSISHSETVVVDKAWLDGRRESSLNWLKSAITNCKH